MYKNWLMPIKKSAKKAYRRSEVLMQKNLKFKMDMKDALRGVKKDALSISKSGKKDDKKVQEMLKTAYSKIDKAAKVGLIHKNTAARKKSRIVATINRIVSA